MPTSKRPLVILHGWSDSSTSFKLLAKSLEESQRRKPLVINLADYVSMDDDITFADITASMEQAWHRHQLPTRARSVDMIVHSTGGLIVRDWLIRYYTPEHTPLRHLVMLAPANFGSHIAHKGRAFYARILKGFKSRKPFNVGTTLLRGLELSSQYTWKLAMADRFGHKSYYGPGKILCTVLIGNHGLTGISAVANQPGSDGVVRLSCANLDCALLEANYSDDPLHPDYRLTVHKPQCAFGILEGENHYTITLKSKTKANPQTLPCIQHALSVTDKGFSLWQKKLNQANAALMTKHQHNIDFQGFQNTVFRVTNQYGLDVLDYFMEFYDAKCHQGHFSEMFYEKAIHSTHAFAFNKSYRNFYINCSVLHQDSSHSGGMHMSIIALPQFEKTRQLVGYHSLSDKGLGSIFLNQAQMQTMFVANRTLLVNLTLRREQADEVFKLKRL